MMVLSFSSILIGPAFLLVGLYTWRFGVLGKFVSVFLLILSIIPLMTILSLQIKTLYERPVNILGTFVVVIFNTIFFTLISLLLV